MVLTHLPPGDMNEHDIFQALDHCELFGILDIHWNPQLLNHINLEGVKGEMKTYKEDLQQFRKGTPLKLFYQSHQTTT